MDKNAYILDYASIVITANRHTPSLLSPSNIAASGIVPDDWGIADAMLSIEESRINYSNGIRLAMDYSGLHIVEPCQESFQEGYLIHRIADTFLEKNPYVPYQSLDLNYQLAIAQEDPQQWLIDRFAPTYFRSNDIDVFAMLPTIFLGMGNALCKLETNTGNVKRGGLDIGAVIININIDHPAPLNAGQIREAIGLWGKKQDFVVSALDAIFGGIEQ